MVERAFQETRCFVSKENLRSITITQRKVVVEWTVNPDGEPLPAGKTENQTIILQPDTKLVYIFRDYDSETREEYKHLNSLIGNK